MPTSPRQRLRAGVVIKKLNEDDDASLYRSSGRPASSGPQTTRVETSDPLQLLPRTAASSGPAS